MLTFEEIENLNKLVALVPEIKLIGQQILAQRALDTATEELAKLNTPKTQVVDASVEAVQ